MEPPVENEEEQQQEERIPRKKEVRWATEEGSGDADRAEDRLRGPQSRTCLKTQDNPHPPTTARSGRIEETEDSYSGASSSEGEVRILTCRPRVWQKTKARQERTPMDQPDVGICRCSRCETAWLHRGWVCPLADDDQSRDGTSFLGPRQT